ncbi:uncharacterized protein LOC129917666 [Episyrphus balteatus]|uniref:uncharacterized protein LOC129917666 n=1 Tax=Episyrphus balteatus TaxID=286459 RepID=UPI00248516CF|nr:uncharacterized protein LOC129917666 [Episyrphus balteatus]
MTKFIQIALLIACAAICCAEPARLRNRQQRVAARQEVAPAEDVPAQTPYPPAGIVPEVRFDLPTENVAVEPDNTYLPPDNTVTGIPAKTYGPPESAEPKDDVESNDGDAEPKAANDGDESVTTEEPEEAETDATPTEQPEDLDQPEVQDPLNDEAEDNEIETGPDDEELLLVVPLTPRVKTARLQARPLIPLRSQRVIAQPIPYRSQRLIGQQLYFADGRYFAYTPQYVRV